MPLAGALAGGFRTHSSRSNLALVDVKEGESASRAPSSDRCISDASVARLPQPAQWREQCGLSAQDSLSKTARMFSQKNGRYRGPRIPHRPIQNKQ